LEPGIVDDKIHGETTLPHFLRYPELEKDKEEHDYDSPRVRNNSETTYCVWDTSADDSKDYPIIVKIPKIGNLAKDRRRVERR
jgi:hypothetical protein